MIHELFRVFNWMGSEWILIVLLVLSITTVWVIAQRWFELRKLDATSNRFWDEHAEAWFLSGGEIPRLDTAALKVSYPCLETEVIDVVGRARSHEGTEADRVAMAYLDSRKLKLEKYVSILGTIGSNAPFVGLLGTVLGIIRAFHDMATKGMGGGIENITGGIAEALVATAIGLLVAVPSVVFFNLFNKRIGVLVRRAQNVGNLALSQKGN